MKEGLLKVKLDKNEPKKIKNCISNYYSIKKDICKHLL